MIYPIVAYGTEVLRKKAEDITAGYTNLKDIIESMWETMYSSNGVGLAAPQINKSVRLFIIDSAQIFENIDEEEIGKYPDEPGTKKVFINPQIIELTGEEWSYNEGCLSIPKIREDVFRPQNVTIEYLNENFEKQKETFNGITGRIIQHEYDHIEGKLFIDYLKPLKKKMLQGKLTDISKGKTKVDYKMSFPK
ncbi:MAG: peptide deformylase [Bacteroidetes bacterium]|nr:peptide deformylase [Bacteroidota bacterium]